MITVKDLRQQGNKVRVIHSRACRFTSRKDSVLEAIEILPRGGRTQVQITTPNGTEIEGSAICSKKDNYCKRTGVQKCIERALISLLLKG